MANHMAIYLVRHPQLKKQKNYAGTGIQTWDPATN